MIKYDYEILRFEKEKGKKVKYIPDNIPKELPSIVYIEGPNSSGKSTILNIISLGFFGEKNHGIYPALREKIKELLNTEHQDLIFKISLTNRDGSVNLIAEKKNLKSKQIDVYEIKEGQTKPDYLDSKRFNLNYRLIYDIPHEPTKRLQSLTNEIRQQFNEYGNKIIELRSFIHKIEEQIEANDNLDNYKKRAQELLKQKKELNGTIPDLKDDLKILEKTVYNQFYHKYKMKHEELKKELDSLEQGIVKKSKKISKNKSKLTSVIQGLRIHILALNKIQVEITSLLKIILKKEDKYLIEIWEEIDFHSTIQNEKFPDNVDFCLNKFIPILIEEENKVESDNTFQEVKMYGELVQLLENYKSLNIKIPGIDQSISDFISNLNQIIRTKQNIINKFKNVKDAKSKLEEIKLEIVKLEEKFVSKLSELKDQIEEDTEERKEKIKEYQHSEELKELRIEYGRIEKIYTDYDKKYKAVGSPTGKDIGEIGKGRLKDFASYTEQQLLDYIKLENKRIAGINKEVNKLDTHIEIAQNEIDKLKGIKRSKYYNSKNEIKELSIIVNDLEKQIKKDYDGYLRDIENKTKKKYSAKQKKYNKAIFNYLGRLLDKVTHENKNYIVESIDLIKNIIYTKEGTEIWLSDMGTGQSQSAYLKSLLSKSDDKMIIALFDEISSMDKKSLKPIKEKMKELYEEGRLLAGILVQKSDEGIKIENWVD